jgi:hypothetical protein
LSFPASAGNEKETVFGNTSGTAMRAEVRNGVKSCKACDLCN